MEEEPTEQYLDRELSWLKFNERVLELAEDPTVPLLERVKFCAIVTSNLDEFFMVRVAGLRRRISAGIAVPSSSGLLPAQLYRQVLDVSRQLQKRQAHLFRDVLLPELDREDIRIVGWDDLTIDEKATASGFFRARVFPVLTPLAVDPSHPFPYISGLSLNLAVMVRNPATSSELFARVKVPPLLPRFVSLQDQRFLPLEALIATHLGELFPGMQILEYQTFRITRNEDVEVEEDATENLLAALERELLRRKFGPPVRLEVVEDIDQHALDLISNDLGVSDNEVFFLPAPLDLRGLMEIANVDRDDLKYRRFVPRTSRELSEIDSASPIDVLSVMRERDILLHHPYHSFSTSVQRFVEQAATDPHVLAIKQTLYRTSGDSPIVDALIEAAENGKQVLAVVEIKARFDEQNNISWARKLEEAGVHVVHGMVGLKTHCKLSLVVRDDGDRLRKYVHIGTGNYHPRTARVYEDYGLLTTDPDIGSDVVNLFNHLSGYSTEVDYSNLLVSPHSVRRGLLDAIDREMQLGDHGMIRIKCNSIVDEDLIDALYRASQAGVSVDLLIRGICGLRPGVEGLSENIRVRSVLGRFLEHSRVFEFGNDHDPHIWIGSADLMHRNLDRRVEVLARIKNPGHVRRLHAYLDRAFSEGVTCWTLEPSGDWLRRTSDEDGLPLLDLQELTIELP